MTLHWKKSSYSSQNGGQCVEVALTWRTSSYSGANGGDCVEVGFDDPGVFAVRDSKHRTGPALAFTPDAWTAFLTAVRTGTLVG